MEGVVLVRKWFLGLGLSLILILTGCTSETGKSDAPSKDSGDEKASIAIWHNFAGDDLRARITNRQS